MKQKVFIEKNGPYIVSGNVPLSKEISIADKNDELINWKKKQ